MYFAFVGWGGGMSYPCLISYMNELSWKSHDTLDMIEVTNVILRLGALQNN